MNKQRRARIEKIRADISLMEDELEALATEEREAFENLSEGLQQSEQGQNTDTAASALEAAKDSFDDLLNSLEEAANV